MCMRGVAKVLWTENCGQNDLEDDMWCFVPSRRGKFSVVSSVGTAKRPKIYTVSDMIVIVTTLLGRRQSSRARQYDD